MTSKLPLSTKRAVHQCRALLPVCFPALITEHSHLAAAAATVVVVVAVVYFVPVGPDWLLCSLRVSFIPPAVLLPLLRQRRRQVTFVCHLAQGVCLHPFCGRQQSGCELQKSQEVGGINKMPELTRRAECGTNRKHHRKEGRKDGRKTCQERNTPQNSFVGLLFLKVCHRVKVEFK